MIYEKERTKRETHHCSLIRLGGTDFASAEFPVQCYSVLATSLLRMWPSGRISPHQSGGKNELQQAYFHQCTHASTHWFAAV